jgi:hypothetical protein
MILAEGQKRLEKGSIPTSVFTHWENLPKSLCPDPDATVLLSHTAKPAAQLPSRSWVLLWKGSPSDV